MDVLEQDAKVFIHIPKTGGTSIRETLGLQTKVYHKRLKDYDKIPRNTFTVIRNPFDRAVSLCAHQHAEGYITPEIFQKWCLTGKYPRLYKKYDISFADPMLDYISVGGEILIDNIVRFETLAKDFKRIFDKELLYLNKGKREDYHQYYDESSYNIIQNRYSDDIKVFNYSF